VGVQLELMARPVLRWAVPYYAATVVFVALDVFAGANLRAVAFAAYPGLRALYYAVLLGCGALSRARPAWAAPITLLESSFSIATMALAVLAPYYVYAVEGRAAPGVDPEALVFNFLLCGSAAALAFHQAARALPAPLARPRGRTL
jgi:hypothetical protein